MFSSGKVQMLSGILLLTTCHTGGGGGRGERKLSSHANQKLNPKPALAKNLAITWPYPQNLTLPQLQVVQPKTLHSTQTALVKTLWLRH